MAKATDSNLPSVWTIDTTSFLDFGAARQVGRSRVPMNAYEEMDFS